MDYTKTEIAQISPWQSMDTAPKSVGNEMFGRAILVFDGEEDDAPIIAAWNAEKGRFCPTYAVHKRLNPTAWMPLPTPPKDAQ